MSVDVVFLLFFFFFKQKTAYEMRISDWSSDVCSSDLSPANASPARVSIPRKRRSNLAEAARSAASGSMPSLRAQLPTANSRSPTPSARSASVEALPTSASSSSIFARGTVASGGRKRVVEGKKVHIRLVPGGQRRLKKK